MHKLFNERFLKAEQTKGKMLTLSFLELCHALYSQGEKKTEKKHFTLILHIHYVKNMVNPYIRLHH